ncbi:MAG: glucose 1-dehydrogenase [Chloroflexi bacterium]|nr:glucose 1-dehydrogenase [Chloroflexota bacterium]
MDVTDKIALVTGGGRGIGRGIGLVLARNGADVVVADLIAENAEAVANEIGALGRESMSVALDVTDTDSIESGVRQALERFGRIDILVNNAGTIGAPGWEARETASEQDWDFIFEVNVKGIVKVTAAVAPHMKERAYGKIINLASIAGRLGTDRNPPYSVSKAGVISLTQSQAFELAPYNINVNAICPGLLWTPMWERVASRTATSPNPEGRSTREVFEGYVKENTPLGREQTPEDIGNLAAFLASDYSMNITGQAINVSGGFFMN